MANDPVKLLPWLVGASAYLKSLDLQDPAARIDELIGVDLPGEVEGVARAMADYNSLYPLDISEGSLKIQFKMKIDGDILSLEPYFGDGFTAGITAAIILKVFSHVLCIQSTP